MKPPAHAVRTRFRFGLLTACKAVLAAGFVAAALAQTATPRITAVRYWSFGDITRVAIETQDEAEYHAERIDSPDRLFIDLHGIDRPAGTRGVQVIPVTDPLVKQIRVAVVQPGVTRVVLDLTSALEYSISQLKNPDRIIVEVRMPRDGPLAPPLRSVTGSQTMAGTGTQQASAPRSAEAPVIPAVSSAPAEGVKPSASAARLATAAAVTEKKPEPVLAASVPSASATAPPFIPPAAREPQPLPEPPRIPPKIEKVETAKVPLESAKPARIDSNGNRSLIRTLGLKLERVVIDPGHGGHDTGTVGPDGLMEKMLVLDVAKRLGALISRRLGSEVIYTRSDDTFVPLEERTRLANERSADLFLSIHANSSRSARISGSETFYLNFTTSADALDVAARENATSQTSIHDLQSLVQKITLNEKAQESRELAAIIQNALHSGIPRNRGTKNRGVKQAPFVVLIGAQMPSVLAEVAFLSNPRDETMLKRADYRQKIAEALFKGVSRYANTLSHFDVAKQQSSDSQAR